jgi:2-polyprenyl-3-methyl-5-hydroxy-6-metoxy-1,4-benzoquinol methylase
MGKYEYGLLAKYYDQLYSNKDYKKETNFLTDILSKYRVKTILDVGCGTGNHMQLLEQKNYICTGLDISDDMLQTAKTKVKGPLHQGNIIDFNLSTKYDAIICMYAVFNHLIKEEDAIKALQAFSNHLYSDGIIIIDLHNPSISGKKEDIVNGIGRKMVWDYDSKTRIEKTSITYNIDNKILEDSHIFRIYSVDEINDFIKTTGLIFIAAYENYDLNKKANAQSKNIQIVLRKTI